MKFLLLSFCLFTQNLHATSTPQQSVRYGSIQTTHTTLEPNDEWPRHLRSIPPAAVLALFGLGCMTYDHPTMIGLGLSCVGVFGGVLTYAACVDTQKENQLDLETGFSS